ncbi:hypothetical protein ACFQO4_17635 [Saliphagus sp. GCM10025334]
MSTAIKARWARRFVAVGIVWFVSWQLATVAGVGRRVGVVLGLYGFVFHVVFGKGYSLLPSYFDRTLAFPRAPAVHLPLAAVGTGCLALGAALSGGIDLDVSPLSPATGETLTGIGASLWLAGCLVFVGTIGWTVRDNLSGRETGTGDANADRRWVDRYANAFVPVVALYVLAGATIPVLEWLEFDQSLVAGGPPVTHLLAAGGAALLLFAVGFRLLPRFLVVSPRTWLVALALPAGALGPALLVGDFLGGSRFLLGAVLEATALVGFALAYVDMYSRSNRRRVGFYAVALGVLCGAGVAILGLSFATDWFGVPGDPFDAHYRLALVGLLGLTVVGVTYQFYPPAVASSSLVDNRTAGLSIALLAGGLLVEVGGLLRSAPVVERGGRLVVLAGSIVYATVVFAVFLERRGR